MRGIGYRTRGTPCRNLPILSIVAHPIDDAAFRARCPANAGVRRRVWCCQGFLRAAALATVRLEGAEQHHAAFYATSKHNVYLRPAGRYAAGRSRAQPAGGVVQGLHYRRRYSAAVAAACAVRRPAFRAFLCAVLDEAQLYPYADRLSSINLHYAHTGQELGWHFDNSSFAITLLIQKPAAGGRF